MTPTLAALFLALTPAPAAQGTAEDYARAASIGERYRAARDDAQPAFRWVDGGVAWELDDGRFAVVDGRGERRTVDRVDGGGSLAPLSRIRSSRGGGAPVDVTFENRLDRPVRLFWVSTGGEFIQYGSIEPGDSYVQSTFGGHVWVSDYSADDLTGIFVAEDWDGIARIDAESRRVAMSGDDDPAEEGGWRFERRGNDLFGSDGGDFEQLTDDGTDELPYTGSAYPAPDGRRALALRRSVVERRRIPILDSAPDDAVQPRLEWLDYVKPGDPLPAVRPALIDLRRGRVIPVEGAPFEDAFYVRFQRWSPDGERCYLLYNRRGHQQLTLYAIDAERGEVSAIVDERSTTFVDYSQKTELHWLDAGGELLWASERDGWNHLYRFDAETGALINQVTSGEWVVRSVEHVDEAAEQIWFTAMGIDPDQDPYHRHLARVDFDGANLVVLTEGDGDHAWEFNDDRSLFIDRWSRADRPQVTELRRSDDGALVAPLHEESIDGLLAEGYAPPERFVAPGRDGQTPIWGHIIRPSNFEPGRRYPVLEAIYAGPHGFHVPKRFGLQIRDRRLAELGFIVVQIDGMGTNWRSKAFHDVCWQNLSDGGFPDRIAWLRAAAERYPELDLERVGIYGGSAGGQNALAALLHHGDFYRAAAADCGCHDNRMDKIWWNEAWMGAMGPHYAENSNVTHAAKLAGDLLLTVGELDRNVDPASTLQVVDALIQADKDFEFVLVPGAGHGVGEGAYLARRRRDFFVRSLWGVDPRR